VKRQVLLPTREGLMWIALGGVLLVLGYLRGLNLVALIACLLIALWIINVVWTTLWYRLRKLRLSRRVQGPVFAGERFPVTLELGNPTHRHQPGLRLIDRGTHHGYEWFVSTLRAREHGHATYEATLPRRGRYWWPELTVRTGYPFGLIQRLLRVDMGDATVVLPPLGQLHRGRLQRLLLERPDASQSSRRPVRRHAAAQTEFYGLREFRTGDSPRWIHWRTTARVGELMVREFVEPPLDNITVILEPWLPEPVEDLLRKSRVRRYGQADVKAQNAARALEMLECAVSLAATILWEWAAMPGARLALGVADRRSSAQTIETGLGRVLPLLETLALVEGTPKPRPAELAGLLQKESLPPGPIVLVTTHATGLEAALAQGLGRPVTTLNVSHEGVNSFFAAVAAPSRRSREPVRREVSPP
jgi:uncharacterized protein (DUF58 family)